MQRKSKAKQLRAACCDDKATLFVFVINTLAFACIAAGLIVYFMQYSFSKDHSDEKWIFPFIWIVPCTGWGLGLALHLSSAFKYRRLLLILPIVCAVFILALLFVAFLFFVANQNTEKRAICNSSPTSQDFQCVVTKDGTQICGHVAIHALCQQIEIGFYFIFMGIILMAGVQVLFMVTGCIRRSRLNEEYRDAESMLNLVADVDQ
eukprot:TRINITY_DN2242_c0_g1_i3.p1 TRINITY_DN2242_c0_g1~~TRINITY_DN2242_c0_g1_i3.p1  ORF type:complete len:206 (+),score=37.05 TRINITY_DN2242_c0_g1_i3:631-1248(+)